MSVERVDASTDLRLAPFRDIGDPELLRRRGQFIAEGRIVVRRAIEDARYRVRAVLVNDAALAQLSPWLPSLPTDTPVYVCDTGAFVALTGFHIHRGCLALVDRRQPDALETAIAGAQTIVVLESVANADNVGAVFRNAAAFGCGAVVLSPACCDPFYRKAIRTSMGAVFRLPYATATPWPDALGAIRAAGFTIVALTPNQPAVPLEVFARERPGRVALLAGTEGAGLSRDAEAAADVRVRIPIGDTVDSLNVATAVAIALYAVASR